MSSSSATKVLIGIRKSYDPEIKVLDVEYLDAFSNNDVETPVQMVKDAFKAAYTDTKVIADPEENAVFHKAAFPKNAPYKGNVPLENYEFTANHFYLYITVGKDDVYPVKVCNIETQ